MTVTREELRTALAYRLGDADGQIWSIEELNTYIQEGYDRLVDETGCLWATDVLPDYAFAFNPTGAFEEEYLIAGGRFSGTAQFTAEFERDYVDNAPGPANHSFHWEYNGGYIANFIPASVLDLPDDFSEMERATWNTRRLSALRSRELEQTDSRYELNRGEVEAYLQDKDGIDRIRKWRVPSAPYVPYSTDSITGRFDHTASYEEEYITALGNTAGSAANFTSPSDAPFAAVDDVGWANHNYHLEGTYGGVAAPSTEFGILVQITDVSSDTPDPGGGFGDFVQIPGEHLVGDPWGVIVAIYTEPRNMRMEYRKAAAVLSEDQDFEIPDRYTMYVRHYAQAKCLGREGPGQDIELSAHFMSRFSAGVARMLKRKQAMQFQKRRVIGGAPVRSVKNPMVRLPWAYGERVR